MNLLNDFNKTLFEIAYYICKNNKFSNKIRYNYKNKLEMYTIYDDIFALLLSVLNKEYSINWQEQLKVVKYCKELLKKC